MEPRRTELKPTKAEVRRRVTICESLLIDCATVSETVRYFAEKEGLILARRTVERYRTIADRRIMKAAEPIRLQEIRKAKLRLERCYARSMTGRKPNVFAAIAAQKAINSLIGLNAPKDEPDEMSVEQLAREIAIQRAEIARSKRGPEGLRLEILDLIERYKQTGQNSDDLLREVSRLVHPPDTEMPGS